MTPRSRPVAAFAAVLLAAASGSGQRADLRPVGSLPEGHGWYRLSFADGASGLLASSTHVWRTRNGGASWQAAAPVPFEQTQGIAGGIWDFQCQQSRCLAVTKGNRLFETTDGAATWRRVPLPAMEGRAGEIRGTRLAGRGSEWAFGGVYRAAAKGETGPNNAMKASGEGGRLLLGPAVFGTSDGGQHWNLQAVPVGLDGAPPSYRVLDLSVLDGAAVLTTGSSVFHTADGGKHWEPSHVYGWGCHRERLFDNDGPLIRNVFLFAGGTGILSPDDGSLYRTADGGASWCQISAPATIHSRTSTNPSRLESLGLYGPQAGLGVEFSGSLLSTQDGGRTWAVESPVDVTLTQIVVLDQDNIWALSQNQLYKIDVHK
jgi:photosystem II stability/assembly factor-like uncharacterized protein